MKKKKCVIDDCKGEAEYCWGHYHQCERRAHRFGAWIAVILLFFVGVGCILPYLFLNVDETEFCKIKINNNFPEEYFIEGKTEISYVSNDMVKPTCILRYKQEGEGKSEQRDGLKYVEEPSKIVDMEMRFELTEKSDIDYLGSDDIAGYFVIFGCGFLFFCGLIFKEKFL